GEHNMSTHFNNFLFKHTSRALMVVLCALSTGAYAQITNPGFESGDLSGWNAVVSGQADPIAVTSGETVTSAGTISPSLSDNFYAFTSQGGPGSSFLTQDFTVQAGTNRIFFDIAINNDGGSFVTPDPISFDFSGSSNQQARFDILAPGASFDTEDPADIIATGFQTQPGDPLSSDWERFDIDVSAELAPFVGQTVTLRFVQVDNQGFFNLAIDNLSVGNAPPPDAGGEAESIPVMPHWLLLLLVLGVAKMGTRRTPARRKH
ncbi:MAG: hypothetical protein RIC38_07105, partial [Chromatocurvus sp.]